MTKYLITPSLLNSFNWFLNDNRENSRDDFLRILSKERTPTNISQQIGIDFEDNVKLYCNQEYSKTKSILNKEDYNNLVSNIGNIVKGGTWQDVLKKDIIIDNNQYLLYGKSDVIKYDTIYDIKTTANYSLGKYYDSMQHRIYMYCSGIHKFKYLIAEKEKKFYIEEYYFNKNTENEIYSCIINFINLINSIEEYKNIFQEKWICKY